MVSLLKDSASGLYTNYITANNSTGSTADYFTYDDTLTSVNYQIDINGTISNVATFVKNTYSPSYTASTVGTYDQHNHIWTWKDIVDSAPSQRTQRKLSLKKNHKFVRNLRGRPSFVDKLPPEEIKALQLLRSLVSSDNFRRYLKYGFVIVQGMSGLSYNIYRRRNTIVYDGKNEVASLCVHLRGNQPPTDEVIAKILMCECEEHEIWIRSNHHFRTKTSKITALGLDKLSRAA